VCDYGLTMPDAQRSEGDPELRKLFEQFEGRLISPGGAAALLGLSRKTIHTLGKRGELRVFTSPEVNNWGPRWAYIPLEDIHAYGKKVNRPVPRLFDRDLHP
jgi:hypothetical protein